MSGLENGQLWLPKFPENPYGTQGVWADGDCGYFNVGTDLWIAVYDRVLETEPPTGVGWRVFQIQPYSTLIPSFLTMGG